MKDGRRFEIKLTKTEHSPGDNLGAEAGNYTTRGPIGAAGQQKFDPTLASRDQAIAAGQGKEFVAAMEALGSEAEAKERWAQASTAYLHASGAAIQIGQLQKALSHATKTLELGKKANPALEANGMLYLADIYERLGQPQKGREWLEKARPVVKRIKGDSRETIQARLYGLLGVSYLRQKEIQQALEHLSYCVTAWDARISYLKSPAGARTKNFQSALQYAEKLITGCLYRLGTAYLEAANTQEAIKAFERGIAILTTSGLQTSVEPSLLMGLGRAYVAQKDLPRAKETFTKALQMAEARQQTSQLQVASTGIANVLLQTDRPSEAIAYFQKAIGSIESTRSLLESEELRTSFFENKGQSYNGIISAHLGAKDAEEAFNYNERARSRAFLDILGSKVQLGKQTGLIEEERALQARINSLKASLAGEGGDEEEGDGDRRQKGKELDAAQKAYSDFIAKVRKENKEQATLINVEPLKLKEVQSLLDPGVTVLEYFILRGRGRGGIVWIIEKDRINVVPLSMDRQETVRKVTSLRQTIQQIEEKDKFKRQSEELYKALIQPALPHIRGKELIIIPHDVLHYLPFQALLSSQGKYLIEDYPINYLSSASLMQFTQEKRKAKGELSSVLTQAGKVLALGNPDLGDPAMSLRFAELEAREVQRLYPQSIVLLKKEATEDKAKGLSPQNDIIHFASHAELSEEDPLASAILLAKSDKEDGRLEVREIFGMDLRASLVVLSACETGLGKLSSGDELVGLTRAFIYAGTPSVMASLWKVEDSSTATLMASFYKNLKTMTKVEALRQAQLELIKGQAGSDLLVRRGIGGIGKLGETQQTKSESASSVPASVSTSHPYFWAPFILVGEGK